MCTDFKKWKRCMKVRIQIHRGLTHSGEQLQGQLLIVDNSLTIIPDKSLYFDGDRIHQEYDSGLRIRPDSLEFLYETEVDI